MNTKEETKNEAFLRLSQSRLEKTVKQIGLISNLSSKVNYDYSVAEASVVLDAVQDALNEAREKFGVPQLKQQPITVTPDEEMVMSQMAKEEPLGSSVDNFEFVKQVWPPEEPKVAVQAVPEVSEDFERLDKSDYANVAWALDMIMRKEYKDATVLLKRVLKRERS